MTLLPSRAEFVEATILRHDNCFGYLQYHCHFFRLIHLHFRPKPLYCALMKTGVKNTGFSSTIKTGNNNYHQPQKNKESRK